MRRHTLLFYRDLQGAHRWRLTHWNGLVVAASTQGYARRIDAVANARLVTGYRHRPSIHVAATDD